MLLSFDTPAVTQTLDSSGRELMCMPKIDGPLRPCCWDSPTACSRSTLRSPTRPRVGWSREDGARAGPVGPRARSTTRSSAPPRTRMGWSGSRSRVRSPLKAGSPRARSRTPRTTSPASKSTTLRRPLAIGPVDHRHGVRNAPGWQADRHGQGSHAGWNLSGSRLPRSRPTNPRTSNVAQPPPAGSGVALANGPTVRIAGPRRSRRSRTQPGAAGLHSDP